MSARDDAVGEAWSCLSKYGVEDPGVDLLLKMTQGLGTSAYGGDNVACTDAAELARIRTTFLVETLGTSDDEATMDSVQSVCARMKPEGSHECRSAFCYLLTKHHGKDSVCA